MGRKPKYATLRTYQPYIDIVMDDLGLTGKVMLDFRFAPYTTMGGDAILYEGVYPNGKRYGEIRIDNRSRHDYILETIMHELKHIQQQLNGMKMFFKTRINNRGRTVYDQYTLWLDGNEYKSYSHAAKRTHKDHSKYLSSPWEADAYAYQNEVTRLFPNNQLPPKRIILGKMKHSGVTFYKIKG